MGIKGLLPFVEKATSTGHVSQFKYHRVAIDVSCLLHRGIFGCIEQASQGIETNFCIKYIEKFVNMFLHYNCQITLVFDGQSLPAKKEVNDQRKVRRDANKELGTTLLSKGKKAEAMKVLRQGIGVPREITEDAIKHFNAMEGIEVIVAPYEADAQLAYLIEKDFVDVVVTQDSDLIVFNCQKIIFKLEPNGSCKVFDRTKLKNCFIRPLCDNFDFEVFRRICILAGCDYLDGGLPGVGLKKAEKFFAKTSLTDPEKFLPRVPGFLNLKGVKIEKSFIEEYIRAEHTFKHQIVYDPTLKIQIPLTLYPGTKIDDYLNPSENITALSEQFWYAGNLVGSERAAQLATGGSSSQPTKVHPFFQTQGSQSSISSFFTARSSKKPIASAPPNLPSTPSRSSLSNSAPRFSQKRPSVDSSSVSDAKRRLVLGDRNTTIAIPGGIDEKKHEMLNKLATIGNGRLFDTGERRSAPAKIAFSTVEVNIPGLVTRPFNFPTKKKQSQKSTLFTEDSENQAIVEL